MSIISDVSTRNRSTSHSANYPHIFEPLDLGFTTLKTVWWWVQCTGLEDRFYNYQKLATYFAERAKGGVQGNRICTGNESGTADL